MRLPTRTEPEFNEQSYISFIIVGILPAIAAINRPELVMTYIGIGYSLFIFLIMCWTHSKPIDRKITIRNIPIKS